MAEETRNASRNVPVGIMWSYAFEAFTGLGMLILFCFCFNEETLNSATGFPFMAVNLSATGSVAGAKALSSIVILLTFISATNFMASASRQTWAFARDHGFPFGKWIGKVSPRVP